MIVTNLSEDEHKVLSVFKKSLIKDEVPFLFKAIPCIRIRSTFKGSPDLQDIDWLGVREPEDEIILSQLLHGSKDNFPFSHLTDNWIAEGNVTARFEDRIYSVFTNFKDLIEKFKNCREDFSINWLKNKVENGESKKDREKEGRHEIFLTARGAYQKQYLSLYETLHYKYVTDFFAKNLLDKYISNFISEFNEKSEILDYQLDSRIRFDKIVVVTVTSQLIGVSLRNLIKNCDDYKFLRKEDQSGILSNCPKLIRLASYFSFQSEKPFEDIENGDRILIVNDVISTGSLVEKLINGIESKGASVNSIMSIADCRSKELDDNQVSSIFFDREREFKIISIINSSKHDLAIAKFKENPIPSAKIKRINPVLNKVVELNTKHSELDRVLYSEPADFMKSDFFNSKLLKIGHYKQNLTHNSYFTDMTGLFQFPNGEKLLNAIKNKLEKKSSQVEFDERENLKSKLIYFQNKYEQIQSFELNRASHKLPNLLKEVIELINDDIKESEPKNKYEPDFIVHPVFSGIEEVSDETFQDIFGTDRDNIISLQRYDTNNGWRFPFPAKRFNKITKNKHILILDSGSLSGHSLVQLVDAISFLEVRRIDFVSIVGRIDDFQREFQSRLRNIKVKPLNSQRDSIIPLNVLFGINLHIPPFRSTNECPFCKEIEFLEHVGQGYITPHAKAYIEDRIQNEIALIKNIANNFTPSYLPKYKGAVDTISIIEMRDKLGKVESYRFYEDYFQNFDSIAENSVEDIIAQEKILKEFELILICILHEPKLHDTLRDLLSNVYVLIYSLLEHLLINSNVDEILYYDWSNYSILRLYITFKNEKAFYIEEIITILKFCNEDKKCLNYLSFIFLEPLYKKSSVSIRNKITLLLVELSNKIQHSNNIVLPNKDTVQELISELLMIHEPVKEGATALQALMNLNLFFQKVYAPQHYMLLKQDISTLSILIDNPQKDKEDIIVRAGSINKRIKEHLWENLNTIKKSKLYKGIPNEDRKNFFEGEDSTSDLIKALDKANSEAKLAYNNSDHYSDETIFKKFEVFRVKLKELQAKHFTPQKDFRHFASGVVFNPKNIIDNAIASSTIQDHLEKRNDFEFENLVDKDILLEGHKSLMVHVFTEIFLNAVKREENNGARVVINLIEEGKYIRLLKIHQDKPCLKSKKNPGQGGRAIIIESIVKGLYGEDAFKEIKNENEFIIEIKIITTDLTKYGK